MFVINKTGMARSKPFYRIALYSTNKKSGDNNNSTYHIDCPHIRALDTSKSYQFAIEAFSCINSTLTSLLIDIPTLTQANSYSTLSQSTNQNVLMTWGDNFVRPVLFNTIGIPLTNIDFMKSSSLQVIFRDVTGVQLTNMTDWCLSFVIWEVQDNEGK